MLWWAAQRGHETVVKLLLAQNSIDLNFKNTKFSHTLLLVAAENGHKVIVRLLLAKNSIDPDSKNIHD